METRIALIGIIVEDPDSVQQINAVLHEYGGYIVGRMGLDVYKRQDTGCPFPYGSPLPPGQA